MIWIPDESPLHILREHSLFNFQAVLCNGISAVDNNIQNISSLYTLFNFQAVWLSPMLTTVFIASTLKPVPNRFSFRQVWRLRARKIWWQTHLPLPKMEKLSTTHPPGKISPTMKGQRPARTSFFCSRYIHRQSPIFLLLIKNIFLVT